MRPLFVLPLLVAAACAAPVTSTLDRDDDQALKEKVKDPKTGSFGGSTAGEGDAPPPASPGACGKIDFVFVIDDSGTMHEEQANLVKNFPKFIQQIEGFRTGAGAGLDYRIAVTTTGRDIILDADTLPSIGASCPAEVITAENGRFVKGPATGCKMTRPWIQRGDPNVEETFACVANVTYTTGSSLEMPLDAMKRSLSDRIADGTNEGFLREDALLAVVMLTDEEDTSVNADRLGCYDVYDDERLTPVASYVSFLDDLKKGHGRWTTAVIAGDRACESAFGSADAAPRLKSFVEQAGKTGKFSSICDGDLSVSLRAALDTVDHACKEFPPPVVK